MMEPCERSPYHILDPSKFQFRLLRLVNFGSDPIQCELSIFSLLDPDVPPWKALSYRWGDDAPELTVQLEGQAINVRKNLHRFLAQMVIEERRDWYFIDALCIDQANDSEKPFQVQQMGEIYRRAEEVVAWIVHEPYYYEANGTRCVYVSPDDAEDMNTLSRSQMERAVLENSFWSRLWIVQEVLLAKRLSIKIGNAEVEWSNLIPEKTILDRRGLPSRNENIGVRNLYLAQIHHVSRLCLPTLAPTSGHRALRQQADCSQYPVISAFRNQVTPCEEASAIPQSV